MSSRKRSYRYRVQCEECGKEFDSDYNEIHFRKVHNVQNVKCHPVIESSDPSQSKISHLFIESGMRTKHSNQLSELSQRQNRLIQINPLKVTVWEIRRRL